jgi:hypothetical protein
MNAIQIEECRNLIAFRLSEWERRFPSEDGVSRERIEASILIRWAQDTIDGDGQFPSLAEMTAVMPEIARLVSEKVGTPVEWTPESVRREPGFAFSADAAGVRAYIERKVAR